MERVAVGVGDGIMIGAVVLSNIVAVFACPGLIVLGASHAQRNAVLGENIDIEEDARAIAAIDGRVRKVIVILVRALIGAQSRIKCLS